VKGDEGATAVHGPPKSAEDVCGSCGGVVVTVVFGGTDPPQVRLRPGSKGRQRMRLNHEGTVFGRRKITIICGGCGTSLIRFEGGVYEEPP